MNIVGVNAFPPTSLSITFYKVIIDDLDTEECVQKKSIRNIKFVSFIRLICFYKSHSIIMEMTDKIYWKTGILFGVVARSSYISQLLLCNIIQLFMSFHIHRLNESSPSSSLNFYVTFFLSSTKFNSRKSCNIKDFFMPTFPLLFILELIIALFLQ